jgi:nucleotide-binding universal stress UspA family protein
MLLETAQRREIGLVVTGVARESAFGRTSAGSTVDALARLSPVPVLAVKTRPNRPYQNIVVATDFSEPSREALLTTLAMFPAANIVLLHAYHVLYEGLMENKCAARETEARQADEKARAFLASTAIGDRSIQIRSEHGSPQHALRELVASGGVDLVVVGTRGRGPIAQLLLGSVARSILAEVPVDVLVASNAVMAA